MDARGADVHCRLAGDVVVGVPVEPLPKDTRRWLYCRTRGCRYRQDQRLLRLMSIWPQVMLKSHWESGVPHKCVVAHDRIAIGVKLDTPGARDVDDVVLDDDAVGPVVVARDPLGVTSAGA